MESSTTGKPQEEESGENTGANTEPLSDVGMFEDAWTGRRRFVTMTKKGHIRINTGAAEFYFDDARAVTIHKKKGEEAIGLKPIPEYDEENDSHHKVPEEASTSFTITATSFIRHYNLQHEETTRYQPEWNDEHEVLIVDLTQEGEVPNTGTETEKEPEASD